MAAIWELFLKELRCVMIDEAHYDPADGEETKRDSICVQSFQMFIYLCTKIGILFLVDMHQCQQLAKKICRCTKIPVRVISPPGELPFATFLNISSLQCEIPSSFASLSIQRPMTCSVRVANVAGLSLRASVTISRGLHSFLAQMVASTICVQTNGVNQFIRSAGVACCLCLQLQGFL